MRATPLRKLCGTVLTLALVSACGSTVQLRSSSPNGLNGLSGLDDIGSTSPPGSGGPALGSVSGTDPGLAPPETSGGAAGDPALVPGGAAGVGVPSTSSGDASAPARRGVAGPVGTAPGVTATEISVGVYTAQSYSSFTSSLGTEIDLGDQAAQAKAVIDHLNANGGIAGRKIVPVFHDADLAVAASNPSAEYQAACTRWTQDSRVYAVISPFATRNNTLYDCLSQAGVPTVNAGEAQDASFFAKYANWFYQPTDMNLTRILSNNVDALHEAGFFGADAKVGVVRIDSPTEAAAVEKGLKPALERHGLRLDEEFAAPNDSSGGSSAYSGAVLKFRSEGITHVMFTFYGSPLLFMFAAENQGYYPKYGLHSRSSPAALLQDQAPERQQRGAMGIGWQPMNDVDAANDPGILNPRQELCLKLMRDAGQDTSARSTALVALWICDNLFFLRDALARSSSFSPADLREGAESLTAFQSASTFRSSFAPSRLHDGARAYRMFAFKDGCACYQYLSPLRPAG